MALPLPNVIPDVGPGGSIVTSMGGINALANAMHLKNINRVKAEYAPFTEPANAISKLAYAQFMAPQFIAKAMTNPGILANMTEGQKKQWLGIVDAAANGQGTGLNLLNQIQQGNGKFPAMASPSNNSLSGWLTDKLKGAFQPNQNPMNSLQQQPLPVSQNMGGNPMELELNKGNRNPATLSADDVTWDAVNLWARSPQGQQKLAQIPNYTPSPSEVAPFMPRAKTYAENEGEFKGRIKQGEESGKYRAEALNDIGKSQIGLSNSGVVLNRMTDIIKNPVMQNMRNRIPFFQDKQLNYLSKVGTPEEQRLIGDFLSTAESFIATTVQGFSGKPLVREFDLAQRQKINPNDTIHVAEGKLRSAIALHDIAEKKNDIIAKLLDSGMSEADAVKQANKMVDISAIEKQTEKLLSDKITEDDINTTMKEMNMTRKQVIDRLKSEGRY